MNDNASKDAAAARWEDEIARYDHSLSADSTRVNDWINKGLALWNLHLSRQSRNVLIPAK